ncbi:polysaccharide deacetylase family protein [Sneathiella limimaris]|uniref:polysaccharide deacetylase family protein n=1 Tax=Sneathiella limimaris TaxID=1964213 RepID=UPI00146A18C4|nr:polysaccharide deacetylase family protein [Sneathiella limimaris]
MNYWDQLDTELNCWAESGKIATFWWRDDDLNEPTPALDRLLHLRDQFDIPLTLATIPDKVDPLIASDLEGCELIQHGVTHQSFSAKGMKKSEFPAERDLKEVEDQLRVGKYRMEDLFSDNFFAFFVPPWNRISDIHIPTLQKLGFAGLSRFKARNSACPLPGFAEINTHIDPVFWRGGRSARSETEILKDILDHLKARRSGSVDASEPTGLLTHHLMFDQDLWAITFKLLSYLQEKNTVRFLTLRGAMALIDELSTLDDYL